MAIKLADPATVLRIYYQNREISNAEMLELFGAVGQSTISRMKKKALTLMRERNVSRLGIHSVNTEVAFEAWGIDVAAMERQYKKLKALGLAPEDRANEFLKEGGR